MFMLSHLFVLFASTSAIPAPTAIAVPNPAQEVVEDEIVLFDEEEFGEILFEDEIAQLEELSEDEE
jgi:hypothetical protein